MYGAILGDMIGAPYEFDRSPKVKDFPLFSKESQFTDDSVMTIAVAEALIDALPEAMGITAKYISKVETGAAVPSLSYVMKFSDITGSDCNYLLRGAYRSEDRYPDRIREAPVIYGDPAAKLSRKQQRFSRKNCDILLTFVRENVIL